jgi:hypothetical protein
MFIFVPFWHCFNSCSVVSAGPYACLLCKMCVAYTDVGSLLRICSLCRVYIDLPD